MNHLEIGRLTSIGRAEPSRAEHRLEFTALRVIDPAAERRDSVAKRHGRKFTADDG